LVVLVIPNILHFPILIETRAQPALGIIHILPKILRIRVLIMPIQLPEPTFLPIIKVTLKHFPALAQIPNPAKAIGRVIGSLPNIQLVTRDAKFPMLRLLIITRQQILQ
jgi:hypothetical protein